MKRKATNSNSNRINYSPSRKRIIQNSLSEEMEKQAPKFGRTQTPRVVIQAVYPEIDGGQFPIKKVVGETVHVKADIFSDGHDEVTGVLLYHRADEKQWHEVPMRQGFNDVWEAEFKVEQQQDYYYTVRGWVDEFATWRKKLSKLWDAGQDVRVELMIGARLLGGALKKSKGEDAAKLKKWIQEFKDKKISFYSCYVALSTELKELMVQYEERKCVATYPKELRVTVDRPKALFSTWYELFPRSFSQTPGRHGTFKDCERLLPEIARMGFDVLYLPPIHPIGTTYRKWKNNAPKADKNSPGSPWAIGGKEGGHKAIHSQLGTLEDFKRLMAKAKTYGIEITMDIAFQCSPDHPYVKEHPQWFERRPDGTIQYAENPPKKYEDIYPINFDSGDHEDLWKELKSIFVYWIRQGVRIFRVDNPHTKPYLFWDWVIAEIRKEYPDVLFLSEAFTRPKVMQRLAKGGFQQSYTYFTWRTSSWDFREYMTELTQTLMREYFRPNFWPNTPDILPYHLQHAGRPAFMLRFILAATLSSNYGIYGPAFELCVAEAVEGKEEYLNSEKYELKQWNWDAEGNLKDFIAMVNQVRRENPALQTTANLKFFPINSEHILCYHKMSEDKSNILLIIVNLDTFHTQSGWVCVPVEELGLGYHETYTVHDLLSGDQYTWYGQFNYVELNPHVCPAHILKVIKHQ